MKSKGESKLSDILDILHICYKTQYSFDDCRNKINTRKLYFDFYLPQYNCCIEYDGEQHFFANGRTWNTEESLKKTKERDNIKNNYCLKQDIPLIRIAYTSFDNLNQDYVYQLIEQAKAERGIIRG